MLFRGSAGAYVYSVICFPSTTPASRTVLFCQGHWMVHPCLIPFQSLFIHLLFINLPNSFLDFLILSVSVMSQNKFQKFSVCCFKSMYFPLSPCLQFCRICKRLYSQLIFHLRDFLKCSLITYLCLLLFKMEASQPFSSLNGYCVIQLFYRSSFIRPSQIPVDPS